MDGQTQGATTRQQAVPSLFHYTTLAGFMGILETGKMWASDLRFLSDSSEIAYCVETARTFLSLRAARARDEGERRGIAFLLDMVVASEVLSAGVYSFSLSEEGDLLSQWRGYAPEGDGVAVRFSEIDLLRCAQDQGFTLEKCVYETEEHYSLLSREVDLALGGINTKPQDAEVDAEVESRIGAAGKKFAWALAKLAPIMKRRCFSEECEWRVCSSSPRDLADKLSFRVSGQRLIPHYQFELGVPPKRVPVASVIVGPYRRGDRQILEAGIRRVLAHRGVSTPEPEVTHSEIPLR